MKDRISSDPRKASAQDILERKGLRTNDNRLVARIPKILHLIVHFAAPEASITRHRLCGLAFNRTFVPR
jgi:hypothetical protein